MHGKPALQFKLGADMKNEASYFWASCGGEIVVLVEASNGHNQYYIQDSLVCCNPMELQVCFEEGGSASVDARRE
ncbi:MAG: hypothetical protein ACI9K5_002570 [Gammaproteobacteria bacterium]|jgi:hypothetical protein